MKIAKQRKMFHIGTYFDQVRDAEVKCIVFNGKSFGWGVLPESLKNAKAAWTADPTLKNAIMMDVCTHFLKSLSKFIEREITIKEVNECLEKGYIEV